MLSTILSMLDLIGAFTTEVPGISASLVTKIIATLTTVLGDVSTLGPEAVASVKTIISTVQGGSALTADQIAQLQALDAQCDALVDAAAKVDGLS